MPASEPGENQQSLGSSILQRVRSRDRGAWERLVKLYEPVLYGWVRRAGISEANAGDVVQDVFLEVSRSIERFRRDREGDTFTGWIRTITQRRCADFRRRSADPNPIGGTDAHLMLQQLPDSDSASDTFHPEDESTAEIVRRGLALIRDEFQEQTWNAFVKTAVEERSAQEAAQALGMSVGAVYMARSRITKRLREELDGLV